MNNQIALIIIAGSQQARIFKKIGKKKDLSLISELVAELDTNHEKPGRTFNSVGVLRHGIEPHTDRREVEKQKFAKKIFENLVELDKAESCDSLIIIASHKMLFEIEQTLSDILKQKLTHKLAKDLEKFTDHEVKEYLEHNLS